MNNFEANINNLIKMHQADTKNVGLTRQIAQLAAGIGDVDTAILFYQKSIDLYPKDSVGYNNLGLLYEKKGDFQNAKNSYLKSLKINDNYEAHYNLGVLFRKEHDFDNSAAQLKKALRLRMGDVNAQTSLGMTYLTQGKFEEGYKYYYRKNPDIKKQFNNPWNGTDSAESILIFCDGGFGDYIMFVRYVPFLKKYFKNILLLVPQDLEELFKINFPDTEVIITADNVNYDKSASVMDLPYLLKMDFSQIPCRGGYLKASDEKAAKYLSNSTNKKAGIFYHGNQRVLKNRSIPFEKFRALLECETYEFYSLQRDATDGLKKFDLCNFSDTAGAMQNLDLVITIDSAAAHLAGALGVKTILMLPFASEWRWFEDTKSTPWYDSVEIAKQRSEGKWDEVLEEIRNKICQTT